MKSYRAFFLLFLLLIASVLHADEPIENLIDIAVGVNLDGSNPSLDDVSRAIIAGCRIKGWTPVLDGDNKILASILVRGRHYAEVEIPFTEKSYSIIYKSSRELKYDQKRQWIHRNYNKWVFLLSNAIQSQLSVRAQNW